MGFVKNDLVKEGEKVGNFIEKGKKIFKSEPKEAKGGLMYPYFPNQFFEFKQCTYSRESLDQSKQKKGNWECITKNLCGVCHNLHTLGERGLSISMFLQYICLDCDLTI